MNLASQKAPPRPSTTPTSASRMPWTTTMFLTVRRLRAEREADPDLLRPLLDRVRHQPVDADRGEQQRAPPKTVITHMLNFWRDTETETMSSIDFTSETGRPVDWRS